jgi:hypothetical protein
MLYPSLLNPTIYTLVYWIINNLQRQDIEFLNYKKDIHTYTINNNYIDWTTTD